MEVLGRHFDEETGYVNPIYCMVTSGARGSVDQIRQLGGMPEASSPQIRRPASGAANFAEMV